MPRASTSWSTLVVVNTNIHEGLIALLLERASVFAASGAEGMQPAGHCLNMACKIEKELNNFGASQLMRVKRHKSCTSTERRNPSYTIRA